MEVISSFSINKASMKAERTIRRQIASAIHAVVQVSRLPDGTRKVAVARDS